ncbi:unnamed protein product [Porites evermanni]|uniref:Uncharacterized protein n=1 Tax=Porites evermanni TaxID=104178 RepID=A0ABN8NAH5_9CNID|nr:unnamed protein product [Porites evermanni]
MHLKELLIIRSEHCPQDRYSDSYHVVFKLILSVSISLNNLPPRPSYLADSYRRPSRNLWSSSQQL